MSTALGTAIVGVDASASTLACHCALEWTPRTSLRCTAGDAIFLRLAASLSKIYCTYIYTLQFRRDSNKHPLPALCMARACRAINRAEHPFTDARDILHAWFTSLSAPNTP